MFLFVRLPCPPPLVIDACQVGLRCFVQEGVDVCVMEVGMGGRFDATNVVPSPVACGVTMLDLDHTQVML